MDIIKLSGVPPWDGRYEFNLKAQPLSTHEWGWIKRLSGWMPLTIEEGYDGGDPELYATFAAIALCRAKKIEPGSVTAVYEKIADAPFGSTITMLSEPSPGDEDDEEDEEDGPPQSSSNGNDASSGTDSSRSSDPSDTSHPRTGTPDSGSSRSDPVTLAT